MLTHQKKQRFTLASYKLLLPLAMLLAVAFAAKAHENRFAVFQPVNPEKLDTLNATFPGGGKARAQYLGRLITTDKHYTDSIHRKQGNVDIQFTVDETGHLTDFVAVKNDIPYLTSLIIQSLKEGPAWTPKTINGKPVSSTELFKLNLSVDPWGRAEFVF